MKRNFFEDNVAKFFSRNKKFVIFAFTIVFLGLTTGVFCTLKTDANIDINFIQDFCLKNYFLQKYSVFGYIFIKIMVFFAIFLVMFLISFLKCGSFLSIIFEVYISFLMGVDCVVVVALFGALKGLILSLFVVAICGLVLVLTLLFFSSQMASRNRGMRCYGKSILNGNEIKLCAFYLLIIVATIVVQGIFLGIVCKIFVF